MAPSIAWAKALLGMLCTVAAVACSEGPVYTLGSKPGPRDAEPDVPDVVEDSGSGGTGGDAGIEAGTGGSMDSGPTEPPFEFDDTTAHPIDELNSEVDDENPTFCNGEAEVYLSSERADDGGSDLYFATLGSDGLFGVPQLLEYASTKDFDTSPAISRDCQTLWVGTNHFSPAGDVDIYELHRPNSFTITEQDVVTFLNSDFDDIPRPPGLGGLVMPIGSRRDTRFDTKYQTFLAELEGSPPPAPKLVENLATVGNTLADGFLTDDGLTLLYQFSGDLYFSERDTPDVDFQTGNPIPGVNTDVAEQDPWLSADGMRLYFTREVDGRGLDIWVIERVQPQ